LIVKENYPGKTVCLELKGEKRSRIRLDPFSKIEESEPHVQLLPERNWVSGEA